MMERLRRLDLRHTCVGDAGVAALGGLAQLEELLLDDTFVTGTGLAALRALPWLRALGLNLTDLADDDLAALAGHPSLAWLGLEECPFIGVGVGRWLAQLPMLHTCLLPAHLSRADYRLLRDALPECNIQ